MKMQRRKFRIGDLAQRLSVDRFVIRFWEKEFDIKSKRSDGGQRFYDEKDYKQFKLIKELLYRKKFTIAGAKQQLQGNQKNNQIIASKKTTMHTENNVKHKNFAHKLLELKNNLIKLKEILK